MLVEKTLAILIGIECDLLASRFSFWSFYNMDNNGMEEISLIISILILIPNQNTKPSFQDIVNHIWLFAKNHLRQLKQTRMDR